MGCSSDWRFDNNGYGRLVLGLLLIVQQNIYQGFNCFVSWLGLFPDKSRSVIAINKFLGVIHYEMV